MRSIKRLKNRQFITSLKERVSLPVFKNLLKSSDGISVSAAGVLKIAYQRNQASVTNSPHQPLLESLAETLQQRKLKLLITIDEISSTPALREFAAIYQILLRNEYHIALLMAGLPSKVSEL